MQSLAEILQAALRLAPGDRARLAQELAASQGTSPSKPGQEDYGPLLALAGTVESEHDDLSTNKYEHVAAAAAHRRE